MSDEQKLLLVAIVITALSMAITIVNVLVIRATNRRTEANLREARRLHQGTDTPR
jgi:hypothetical protein